MVSSKLIIGVKHDVRKAGKHAISMKADEIRRRSGSEKHLVIGAMLATIINPYC